MLEQYFQVLLIEDDLEDADIIKNLLDLSHNFHCGLVHARTLENGLDYLNSTQIKHYFDAVFLDLSLPDAYGIDTVKRALELNTELPFIVLTGLNDKEVAIQALRLGAQDYLIKDKIDEDVVTRTLQHSIERTKLLNQLTSSEERYAISVQGANDGLWDWDLNQKTIYFSPRWKLMLGYEDHEISNHPDEWLQRIHPQHLQQTIDAIAKHLEQEDNYLQIEHQIRHKNGDYIWGLCRGTALWNEDRQVYRMAGSLTDVTQRKYLERKLFEEKELAMITLQSIGDAVITTNKLGEIESLNPAAEEMTGWSNHEAKGQSIDDVFKIVDEENHEPLPNPVELAIQQDRVVSLSNHPVLLNRQDGAIAIDDTTAPIHSNTGDIIGSVVVFHDVSEARGRAQQLSWQANHDALTGLLNRRAFSVKLEEALSNHEDGGNPHILCFIDLDHFKVVNDTCGHAAGDKLLQKIAAIIQDHVRKTDIVARVGGDEFIVLLCGCPLDHALRITNSLCVAISQFRFAEQERLFKIGCSIGISVVQSGATDSDGLINTADAACYVAKQRGRNRVHIYQPEDQGLSMHSRETQWFTCLSEAIESDQFQLFHQPIRALDKDSENTSHYEVLLRLVNEHGHLISPEAFLPAAERYSLMPEIDSWVICNCFQYLSDHINRKKTLHQMVINNPSL